MQSSRLVAAIAALVALAACADSTTAPTSLEPAAIAAAKHPKPTPTPAPTPAPDTGTTTAPTTGTTVATCTGGTIVLSADEKRTLDLHNQQRASSGLVAFCVDATLTTAARAHSDEMLAKGYFAHESYDGETFDARLVRYGYTGWTALAENVAYGSGSLGAPDAIFSSWMNSAGHRANILNGSLRQIGIGARLGTYQGHSGTNMYTVDFGTR